MTAERGSPTPATPRAAPPAGSGSSAVPLRTESLAVGYGGRTVLAGLDLELRAGELVCLLGPNGAGKSTLLRTLAGLQPALSGRMWLGDRDADTLPAAARARRTAIVLTERLDAGHLAVWDLAALGRHPHTGWSGRLSQSDRDAIRRGLEDAGAWDLRDRPCDELSDGEKQRALLARALAQDPDVLLLDEPTAFLDLPRRVEAMHALRRIVRDRVRGRGRAVLLSTHDLDLALRAADRLWLVSAAGTFTAGLPEELALSGAIGATFDQGDVAFDRSTGEFRIHGEATRAARIAGDPELAFWTARALAREGISSGGGEEGSPGSAGAGGPVEIEVRAERGPAGPRWTWRAGAGEGAIAGSGSLEGMLRALRALRAE
jgi:iron complex transport system ATP-binding protein